MPTTTTTSNLTSLVKTLLESQDSLTDPTQIQIGLNPVPASRPRVSKWGTYYLKTYSGWRKAAKLIIKSVEVNTPNPLIVVIENRIVKPRTSKKLWPRGDVDNYAKAPLDILNKKLWVDDDQIQALWVDKVFVKTLEEAKTILTIFEVKQDEEV